MKRDGEQPRSANAVRLRGTVPTRTTTRGGLAENLCAFKRLRCGQSSLHVDRVMKQREAKECIEISIDVSLGTSCVDDDLVGRVWVSTAPGPTAAG